MKIPWLPGLNLNNEQEPLMYEDIERYSDASVYGSLYPFLHNNRKLFTDEEYRLLNDLIETHDKSNFIIAYELITAKDG